MIIILIFSVVIHEVSHGYAAYIMGDSTAKYQNRLTLNPIHHLDPFGSVILPFFLAMSNLPVFGWAKPVPINYMALDDKKYGVLKVAIAGPLANIIIAIFFSILIRFIPLTPFFFIVWINLILAIFNLIPIPPLDGHHILFALLPHSMFGVKKFLMVYGRFILLAFIFFGFRFIVPAVQTIFTILTGYRM